MKFPYTMHLHTIIFSALILSATSQKLFWSPPLSFQPLWTVSSEECAEKTVYDDGKERTAPKFSEGKCFSREKILCSLDRTALHVSEDLIFGTRWTTEGKMQCLYNIEGFLTPKMIELYISIFGLEKSWSADASADVSTRLGITEAIENVCSEKIKDLNCIVKTKKMECPLFMTLSHKGTLCRRLISHAIHQLGDPLFINRISV